VENNIKTISFPAISTGVYGYPIDKAAPVALKAVIDFVKENDFFDEVVFVLYPQRAYDAYEHALNVLVSEP